MDEIGLQPLQRAHEPRQQHDVELTAHRQRDDLRALRLALERAAARADEHVVVAGARQLVDEIADLGRSAVQVPARFDVRDAHCAIIPN